MTISPCRETDITFWRRDRNVSSLGRSLNKPVSKSHVTGRKISESEDEASSSTDRTAGVDHCRQSNHHKRRDGLNKHQGRKVSILNTRDYIRYTAGAKLGPTMEVHVSKPSLHASKIVPNISVGTPRTNYFS